MLWRGAARPVGGRSDPALLSWRKSVTMTGGTSGLFGIGAGATQLLDAGPEVVICLCASAVLCAAITAAVAIVATVVGRPPEARRMAALDRLARKAETPSERRAAMALLAMDKAIARDGMRGTALTRTLLAEMQSAEQAPSHPTED